MATSFSLQCSKEHWHHHARTRYRRHHVPTLCIMVEVVITTVLTITSIWWKDFEISNSVSTVNAFAIPQQFPCGHVSKRICPPSTNRLYGISEWRDKIFDFPGTGNDRRLGTETTGPPKEICILPFPYDDVLLQGETKQLRLYEERFLNLFDYCMGHHEGVVAMGLLADTGIIQTVPLCEIEAFNRMEGFGIFVTIRVVGRAQLDEVVQQTPFLKAVCRELSDNIPPNLELPNLLASNIDNYLLLLSSMEAQLATTPTNETNDEQSEEAAEMKRRIQVAKLVSKSL
jgi:Lon protease-like protein